MATSELLSSISPALSQIFDDELYKQWNRVAILAGMVPAVPGKGKNAAWDVEFTGTTAQTVAEGSDVPDAEFASDTDQPAIMNWAHYRTSFKISETELDAAATSRGTANALMDLFVDRVVGGAAKLVSLINSDMYNGTGVDSNGNPTIVGLAQGPLESTGIYAGLSKTTFTEWASNKLANGGTARPLSFDLLYQLEQQIYTASGEVPSMIVTTPAVYRKYAGLFEEVRRLATDGRGPMTYEAGAAELFWKGIPVVRDKDAPAGKLFMITPHYLSAQYLPRMMSPLDGFGQRMEMLEGSNGREVKTMTQIPGRITMLAKTGDSLKVSLKTSLQLLVKRPNSCGQIVDISEV